MMKHYHITEQLTVEGLANSRYQDLDKKELNSKYGCRVIGGDKGDIHFYGYDLNHNETMLRDPFLFTSLDLTDDDVNNIAKEILQECYNSIGLESVQ